ncbi:flavodoxin domain-containing protein [Clostridium sp. BJN0001]|uniref:flavodoxin domain-containing protein n=1 Tax=Clostridium sp. BJN0001 TaxID=2930219 RepID=UPI001FD1CF28|nr:flavodoxin domain-containing protein [Clostridium sp. BJN0001]
MKTLIVFASKHGTTKDCAKRLERAINGEVSLIDIKKDEICSINEYDNVILGGAIYGGMVSRKLKKFISDNKEILLKKNLGIYICCMSDKEKINSQFEQNFSKDILDKAFIKSSFGGEFHFLRMNFFEKFIIKQIYKNDKSQKIDGKKDIKKLDLQAIKNFAKCINDFSK